MGRWELATSLFVRRRPLVRFRIIRGVNGNLIAFVKPSAQVDQPASFAAERHCRAQLGLKLSTTDRTFNASHHRSNTPAARQGAIAPKRPSDARLRPVSKPAGRPRKETALTLIARAARNRTPWCLVWRKKGGEPAKEKPDGSTSSLRPKRTWSRPCMRRCRRGSCRRPNPRQPPSCTIRCDNRFGRIPTP